MFWEDTMIDINSLADVAQIAAALDGGIPADEVKGLTAVRIIMRLSVQAVTASTSGLVSMGIYLVEGDAAAAAVFAEPQDTSDDAGWMYRNARQLWARDNGAVSTNGNGVIWFREDLHAMRKYPGEDYTLRLIVNNHNAAGAVINVDGMVRTLFKKA